MRAVEVDAERRTARAQGGATWGDFNEATHAFGLATTGGIISTTGVAGLTLGGGIGYLARGFGLSCDNLLSAEVVTADGRTVTASEDENADLFWAIRGGGGNFGVVTSLEFRLHPVETIYGGPMFFELDEAETVLRFYREFIADAPEQFGGFPAFQIAPPLPFIPEDRHGEPFLAFVACWAGPVERGRARAQAAPRRRAGRRRARRPDAVPGAERRLRRAAPAGLQHYWKANFVDGAHRRRDRRARRARPAGPDGELDDAHLPDQRRLPPGRAGRDGVRLPRRELRAGDRRACGRTRPTTRRTPRGSADYYEATAPHSEEGGYINFMAGDDQDRIKANYRGNYDRLVEVKRDATTRTTCSTSTRTSGPDGRRRRVACPRDRGPARDGRGGARARGAARGGVRRRRDHGLDDAGRGRRRARPRVLRGVRHASRPRAAGCGPSRGARGSRCGCPPAPRTSSTS